MADVTRGRRYRRGMVLVVAVLVTGCATSASSRATPVEAGGLSGAWRGWIVTPPEFTPATLEVRPDGTFSLSGARLPVTRVVTGAIFTEEGTLRFEGAGGWRGVIHVSAGPHGPVLTMERADRLFPGRFTREPRS